MGAEAAAGPWGQAGHVHFRTGGSLGIGDEGVDGELLCSGRFDVGPRLQMWMQVRIGRCHGGGESCDSGGSSRAYGMEELKLARRDIFTGG